MRQWPGSKAVVPVERYYRPTVAPLTKAKHGSLAALARYFWVYRYYLAKPDTTAPASQGKKQVENQPSLYSLALILFLETIQKDLC